MQNLTYGISLKVSSGGYSSTVINSQAAATLPLGKGDAYIYKDADDIDEGSNSLTRFRGFDIKAPYVSPAAAASRASTEDGKEAPRVSRPVVAFRASSMGGPTDTPDEIIVEAEDYAGKEDRMSVRDALLGRLAQFNDVQPRQLWMPTLKAPLTYHDVRPEIMKTTALKIRIGDLDNPRKHRREPYYLVPEDANAHIRIAGSRGCGKSTTIETIIATSGLSYGPHLVSFYIIDCGTKLSEVAEFPNVGAYALRDDDEKVQRIFTEFLRIATIRYEEAAKRKTSSFAAYFASKQENRVAEDPYGHMFLVIDDLGKHFFEEDARRMDQLLRIADNGGSLGIHLLVSTGPESINSRLDAKLGLIVQHYVSDTTSASTLRAEYKPKAKLIPSNQPGRVFDQETGLHGRVVVPLIAPFLPEPDSEPSNPEYNYRQDHGPKIHALGKSIAIAHDRAVAAGKLPIARAPRIQTVAEVITWRQVWEAYSDVKVPGERSLPLGIAADNLAPIALPDTRRVSSAPPHLVIAGDHEKGKTGVIRSLMRSITTLYAPGEAEIYLFDPGIKLIDERQELERLGLLGGYTADKNAAESMARDIADLIRARIPTDADNLTAEMMRNRTWYSGPEIFVLADPANALVGSSSIDSSALDQLRDVIAERNDLGLRVFVTMPSAGFAVAKNRPFFKTLYAAGTYTLLLSGTDTDTVFGAISAGTAIKFMRRRPGLGQLHDANASHNPIVQVGWEPAWGAVPGSGD
jgi:S-DNA-T family DNA segregation ATPase FtsK/SpoIIIE